MQKTQNELNINFKKKIFYNFITLSYKMLLLYLLKYRNHFYFLNIKLIKSDFSRRHGRIIL